MKIVKTDIKIDLPNYGLYMENIEKIFFHDGILSVKTKNGGLKTFFNSERFGTCERDCINVEKYQLREMSLLAYEEIGD